MRVNEDSKLSAHYKIRHRAPQSGIEGVYITWVQRPILSKRENAYGLLY